MNKEFKQLLEDFKYYNSKGNIDRSKIILDELTHKYPYDTRVIFSEALYYDRLRTYDDKIKALDKLKELIDMDAKNKDAAMYEYIRIISYMHVKSDEIDKYFKYLIENNYKVEHVYFYYGRYLEGKKLYEEAKEMYTISKELGYEKAEKRLLNLNYLDDVNAGLDDSINHENNNLFDLELSINQLYSQGYFDEIRKALNEYENKNDNTHNFSILYQIFKTYIAIGYLEDAKEIYNKNYKYITEDFLRVFLEARIDLCEENFEDAIVKFNQVISYDKSFVTVSYYYLAQIANLNKQYDLEKEYYTKMMEKSVAPEYARMKLAEIDIYDGKYEDAKEKIQSFSTKFIEENELPITQMKAMLGLPLSGKYFDCYSVNQIKNYDEKATYYHIQKHTDDYGINERCSIFSKDVDLLNLVSEVRELISHKDEDYRDAFSHYIIEYKNIGCANDKKTDLMEVVAIPHTDKIITMYPIFNSNIFIPNKVVEEKPKLKRKSQIDKFYERYGK